MTLHSVSEITEVVASKMSHDANIILGTARQDSMRRDIQVVVIATGFPTSEEHEQKANERIDHAIENPGEVDIPPFLRKMQERDQQRRTAY